MGISIRTNIHRQSEKEEGRKVELHDRGVLYIYVYVYNIYIERERERGEEREKERKRPGSIPVDTSFK